MRRKFSYLFPLISIFLLFSTLSYGQAWSGILAPARATDWTYAGIPGGIPTRTSVCANVSVSDSTSQIQSKLNSCPQDGVVLFPAGTWNLTSSLFVNNKGIVLRGAGPTQTVLNFGSGVNIIFAPSGSSGQGGYGSGPYFVTNWTGGLTQGSSSLTVASTSNMAVGQLIVLDQKNNTNVVFGTGNEGSQRAGRADPPGSDPFEPPAPSPRLQFQLTMITAVNDGTHITVDPPVDYTHNSSLAPQIFWWDTAHLGNGTKYAGVENLKIDANGNDRAIMFDFCTYCWVKNVEIGDIARGAITTFWSYRNEFRDSYIWQTGAPNGPVHYGFEIINSTLVKEENNILFNSADPFMSMSSDSLVSAYNYSAHLYPDPAQFAAFEPHQSHNFYHLYEGNVIYGVNYDNVWGSSSHNTMFRNYSNGIENPSAENYRTPLSIYAQNRYINIVGNVLGDPTYHTQYVCDSSHSQSTDNYVYNIGFWHDCPTIDGQNAYDSTALTSLVRWGNWDGVTWKANGNANGVRWCTGNGAGNPACTASETASTDPNYPGLANPNSSLPASFYNGVTSAFPSCGTGLSYWKNPSTGFCPPYPPIGPEVACTTNCSANTANHAALIPAELCYANSAKNGNGYLTAFDANACYASDPSSDQGPQAPTGLAATVQ